ncbi:LacI family transcriptional regulator [Streptomyces antnestii]|uniref:LacI family transcriptional regulator n=1 Tax=Streptomyces antnestii TaxID=2494256 RepID=A0A3S2VI12_9ACTN|nr:LacI family DNA-binding transcriptional regulator [Streptomyces sp. San01]RVU24321.1 LacI family transcriptional regulator [Streptomyces sp. San01]
MPNRQRRVTLRDIAKDTGLSPAAVSYALRGLQVPEETQQRVREAADRLGYRVDPIARALASGRTDTVGVLCQSLSDVWQQGLAAALGRRLLATGRHALIVDASNDPQLEAQVAAHLAAQRVDALIVLPVDPSAAHWQEIGRQTVLISIGDGLPGAATAAEVVFDNDLGVTDALGRLASAGHHTIAVVTPNLPGTPDRPAEGVVHRVAAELGLAVTLHTSPYDLDGATAVARTVLTGQDRPTAFLCLGDSMAYGVYAATQELGLTIPDDVSVLGYDDQPLSRLLTPPLSSYRWPVEELLDLIVERTVKAIEDGRHSRRKVLPPTVQLRGSIARPRDSAG